MRSFRKSSCRERCLSGSLWWRRSECFTIHLTESSVNLFEMGVDRVTHFVINFVVVHSAQSKRKTKFNFHIAWDVLNDSSHSLRKGSIKKMFCWGKRKNLRRSWKEIQSEIKSFFIPFVNVFMWKSLFSFSIHSCLLIYNISIHLRSTSLAQQHKDVHGELSTQRISKLLLNAWCHCAEHESTQALSGVNLWAALMIHSRQFLRLHYRMSILLNHQRP